MTAIIQSRLQFSFLRIWTVFALSIVLLLVFITPPFQVPDEPQHFFRAYQISDDQLIGEVKNGASGGHLPSSLPALSKHFLGTSALHTDRPVRPTPLAETLKILPQPLNAGSTEFVVFGTSNAPLAYLPQALAIKLGKLADASPLTLLYLCRMLNGICAVLLLAWAISLMPIGRELAAFAALLPMAVFLYASASPDAMIIASTFLYTALVLNRLSTGTWSHSDTVVSVLAAITFCTVKPVYLPLLLLGFMQVFHAQRRVSMLLNQVCILIITIVMTGLWMRYSVSVVMVPPEVSLSGQLNHVVENPLLFLASVARSIYWDGFYYKQMIGILGWLSILLPSFAYLLPIAAVLLALGSEKQTFTNRTAICSIYKLAILGACVLLVMTGLYLSWTPVGELVVKGVQGRYFLPLLPLGIGAFLTAFGWKSYWSKSMAQAGILLLIVLEAVMTLLTICKRYSVF